jgi:hypothetical protein
MSYLFPSTGRAIPKFRPRRLALGCGSCRAAVASAAGLGAIAVPLNTTRPRAPRVTSAGSFPITGSPIVTGRYSSYPSGSGANTQRQAWRTQRQQQSNTNVNTTGAPSTIKNYDAYGNPVYSVPPPGAQVTGYDAAGNPLYGASSGSVPSSLLSQTSAITSYDPAGTPIYSAAPPGQVIVSYDAYGNPIYSGSAAASSLLTSAAAAATPAAAASVPATSTDSSGYQSILDWLSEQTLVSGFPNWGVGAALVGGFLLIQSHLGGRR